LTSTILRFVTFRTYGSLLAHPICKELMLKCNKCGAAISDKRILSRCAEIAGKALAKKRGPDYYRQIQGMRKVRAGGRPRKK